MAKQDKTDGTGRRDRMDEKHLDEQPNFTPASFADAYEAGRVARIRKQTIERCPSGYTEDCKKSWTRGWNEKNLEMSR